MKTSITQVQLLDPFRGIEERCDLYIEDGRLTDHLSGRADRTIDGQGLYAFPAFVDLHTHLRDPGFTDAEDVLSGCRAAAAGGYGLVSAMPNTQPVCDQAPMVQRLIEQADQAGLCQLVPIPAASLGLKGEALSDFSALKAAGAMGVTDDGQPFRTAALTRDILLKAKSNGLLPIDHPEEKSLSRGVCMNAGPVADRLGVKGMPRSAEAIPVARDLLLAAEYDAPIHLCHLSTKESVDLVRLAKARGIKVTADTCPHYFSLTEEAVLRQGAMAKMYPPLRREEDRQAIIAGLADGTLDAIATDHAPHTVGDKGPDLAGAKNGIIGLETAFPLAYEVLVCQEGFSLQELVSLFTVKPARVLALGDRSLAVGQEANLCLWDLHRSWTYDPARANSKSRNTPFGNRKFQAQLLATFRKGNLVYESLSC